MNSRVLVLNQSYEFLGFTDWKTAICMAYTDKVTVEEEYDQVVRSSSTQMNIPAVIRLRKRVRVLYEKVTFVSYSKRNVHLRDNFTCQYCGDKKKAERLGIDHVQPESRGGLTTWENTVSACHSCNGFKDNRTPSEAGMRLIRVPTRPKGFTEILRIKIGELHDLWVPYL